MSRIEDPVVGTKRANIGNAYWTKRVTLAAYVLLVCIIIRSHGYTLSGRIITRMRLNLSVTDRSSSTLIDLLPNIFTRQLLIFQIK